PKRPGHLAGGEAVPPPNITGRFLRLPGRVRLGVVGPGLEERDVEHAALGAELDDAAVHLGDGGLGVTGWPAGADLGRAGERGESRRDELVGRHDRLGHVDVALLVEARTDHRVGGSPDDRALACAGAARPGWGTLEERVATGLVLGWGRVALEDEELS